MPNMNPLIITSPHRENIPLEILIGSQYAVVSAICYKRDGVYQLIGHITPTNASGWATSQILRLPQGHYIPDNRWMTHVSFAKDSRKMCVFQFRGSTLNVINSGASLVPADGDITFDFCWVGSQV